MAGIGCRKAWNKKVVILTGMLILAACGFVSAQEGNLEQAISRNRVKNVETNESDFVVKTVNFLLNSRDMLFQHVWPVSFLILLHNLHLNCTDLMSYFFSLSIGFVDILACRISNLGGELSLGL